MLGFIFHELGFCKILTSKKCRKLSETNKNIKRYKHKSISFHRHTKVAETSVSAQWDLSTFQTATVDTTDTIGLSSVPKKSSYMRSAAS